MSLPLLPFGRTGHDSTRVIFGGAALGRASQAEADRALDALLEHGVNHLTRDRCCRVKEAFRS